MPNNVVVIGGGPAGLMAAEVISNAGHSVHLYDAMPSVGRKFLMAGKGGLNLTHSEAPEKFLRRYAARRPQLEPMIKAFGPEALRAWAHRLGIETFVGSSGRVFPTDFKAAPLLRAWLHRLRETGVYFHVRHRWAGWSDEGALMFHSSQGDSLVEADAVVLALGGGSWARLGSDGEWVSLLKARGIPVAPLQPANCGFDVDWSEHFRQKFSGAPVKAVAASISGGPPRLQGEFVITGTGVEGGLIYALSAALRDAICASGSATLTLDLAPGRDVERLIEDFSRPRESESSANFLRRRAGIEGVKAGLLREVLPAKALTDPVTLASAIKSLRLLVTAPRPIDEAISTAGGVAFEALDSRLMLRSLPSVFCAGEMLDWEAPTGGYLLTGCFASGAQAGGGVIEWLRRP